MVDEETIWNVLLRYCRRPYGLVGWGYGIAATKEVIVWQVTASTMTPWDVCEE